MISLSTLRIGSYDVAQRRATSLTIHLDCSRSIELVRESISIPVACYDVSHALERMRKFAYSCSVCFEWRKGEG